jgi:putative hydrolase of the HAD superfamily
MKEESMKAQNAEKIKIKAVVFDFGNVLSFDQPSGTVEKMAAICKVPVDVFRVGYWNYRLAYDRGDLDFNDYWEKRMQTIGVKLSAEQIAEIILVDCEGWSHLNPVSVDWVQQLRAAGLQLAVLSNMPLDLRNYMVTHLSFLNSFHYLVFSCDVRRVKPEPEIYQHCLNLLQLAPQEILFLDDKLENIEAAAALGIQGILVDSIENTIAHVRDKFDLPIPASLQISVSLAE